MPIGGSNVNVRDLLGIDPRECEDTDPTSLPIGRVKAIIAARYIQDPSQIVLPLASGDPFLIVAQPPNSSITFHTARSASTSPQDLDSGFFGANRRSWSVFNDAEDANLYLKLGFGASLTSFTVKVPPQHLYEPPHAWVTYAGPLNGVWDQAEGGAQSLVMEFA